jgi:hypothetical protein
MPYLKLIIKPILLFLLSLPTQADVFKCKDNTGKTIYQPDPCVSGEVTQGIIKVKPMTPEENEAAKAKLSAWQKEQAAYEAEKKAVEKERQAELEKQESLALQRRSVIAQEEQAIAAQQRQYQGGGGGFFPYFGFNRRLGGNQPYMPYGPWQPQVPPYHQPHQPWNQNMMIPPSHDPIPETSPLAPINSPLVPANPHQNAITP